MDSIEKLRAAFPTTIQTGDAYSAYHKIIFLSDKYTFMTAKCEITDKIRHILSCVQIFPNKFNIQGDDDPKPIALIQIDDLACVRDIHLQKRLSSATNIIFSDTLVKDDFREIKFETTVDTIKTYGKNYKKHLLEIIEHNVFSDLITRLSNIEITKKDIRDLYDSNAHLATELLELQQSLEKSIPKQTILTETCAICMCNFAENPMEIVSLSCGHFFCESCLKKATVKQCAVCKMDYINFAINTFIKNQVLSDPFVLLKIQEIECNNKIETNKLAIEKKELELSTTLLHLSKIEERRDNLQKSLDTINLALEKYKI